MIDTMQFCQIVLTKARQRKSKFYIKYSGVNAGALSRVLEKRDSGKTSFLRLTETVVFLLFKKKTLTLLLKIRLFVL